ncbi:hypothetical protein ACQ86N_04860 [Puia sp. P3]|uniref:hypothetical protein n=1 Tax=Puia sp. P3 TaxID=3423952 RepID=UPI003D677E14
MKIKLFIIAVLGMANLVTQAQRGNSAPLNLTDSAEVDYELKDFKFQDGETIPALRLHYTTFGKPVKDKNGKVANAVYIMHGTTGNSHNFVNQGFGGHLFEPGQTLDASKYFIILPDGIGHGKSSKPSDGLHMKFPKYTYDDMVQADYKVLTEKWGSTTCASSSGPRWALCTAGSGRRPIPTSWTPVWPTPVCPSR